MQSSPLPLLTVQSEAPDYVTCRLDLRFHTRCSIKLSDNRRNYSSTQDLDLIEDSLIYLCDLSERPGALFSSWISFCSNEFWMKGPGWNHLRYDQGQTLIQWVIVVTVITYRCPALQSMTVAPSIQWSTSLASARVTETYLNQCESDIRRSWSSECLAECFDKRAAMRFKPEAHPSID